MYAGFLWLTAGGNSGSTKKAQDVIQNAIMGLVLTLGSYLILYTINPDLVKLNPFTINKVAELTMSQKLIPESQDPGSGNGPVGALPTPDKMQMKPPYTTLNVPTSCAGRDARMTPALVSGAMDLQHKYGIPGAIILAQWALESAYGQSPSGQYNYFGIKCTQSSPPCQAGCTQKTTQENTKSGGAVTVQACFKDFASPSAGLEGHARYLTLYNVNNAIPTKTGSWYDYNGNPTSFATFLQKEGYATDPIYASKLQGILTSQCLL